LPSILNPTPLYLGGRFFVDTLYVKYTRKKTSISDFKTKTNHAKWGSASCPVRELAIRELAYPRLANTPTRGLDNSRTPPAVAVLIVITLIICGHQTLHGSQRVIGAINMLEYKHYCRWHPPVDYSPSVGVSASCPVAANMTESGSWPAKPSTLETAFTE